MMATPSTKSDGPLALIGFAESLAAIESAWILLAAGFRVAAFTRSGHHPALERDKRIAVFQITSPQVAADDSVTSLIALAERLRPAAVLPLDDDAVWLCDRASTSGGFPIVSGPTGSTARMALDKRVQLEFARKAGLTVPPTAQVDSVDNNAQPLVPDTDGPWIVKPALAAREVAGRLVRGTFTVVPTEPAVRAVIEAAGEPMLVQPVLRGVGEGAFGHAHEHGVAAWSAHRRIRMMNPAGSGSSACRSINPTQMPIEAGARFVAAAQWRGLFMLEFLRDSAGTPWFMELNGRTWGSMALARRRGLAYPAWTMRATLDPHFVPDEPPASPDVVARHLGREILHLAFVARGPGSGSRPDDWPRMGESLRQTMRWGRADRLYNYQRGHVDVLLADTRNAVAAARRGRGRRTTK